MNPALDEIILEQTAGAKFTAAQWAAVRAVAEACYEAGRAKTQTDLLTLDEVAEKAGVSYARARQCLLSSGFPHQRAGRRYLVDASFVEEVKRRKHRNRQDRPSPDSGQPSKSA